MARKTKRRQQPARARRPAAPAAAQPAAGPRPSTAARPDQSGRVGGDQALVRAVEMSLAPAATAAPPRRGSSRIVLESADPAIPLDRVPYFGTDLKRLGIVAAIMLVLLVVGAQFVIPLFVR